MVWFPKIFHKSLTVKIPTYKMMNRPTNFTLKKKREYMIYLHSAFVQICIIVNYFIIIFFSLYKISVIMTVHLKKA